MGTNIIVIHNIIITILTKIPIPPIVKMINMIAIINIVIKIYTNQVMMKVTRINKVNNNHKISNLNIQTTNINLIIIKIIINSNTI